MNNKTLQEILERFVITDDRYYGSCACSQLGPLNGESGPIIVKSGPIFPESGPIQPDFGPIEGGGFNEHPHSRLESTLTRTNASLFPRTNYLLI